MFCVEAPYFTLAGMNENKLDFTLESKQCHVKRNDLFKEIFTVTISLANIEQRQEYFATAEKFYRKIFPKYITLYVCKYLTPT